METPPQLARRWMPDLRVPLPASDIFNFVRWLAALLVMLSHVRALFFVQLGEVSQTTPFVKLVWMLTGMGHQAVMVFFVMSGFFISSAVLRSLQSGRWSARQYLINRLARLWVVLIPALLLTLMWDTLGIHLFSGSGVYDGLPQDHYILAPVRDRLDPGTFLGNLFFLQGIKTATFGSNGPLWSLSYEFWYYIAFPCLLFLVLPRKRLHRLLCGVCLAAVAALVGSHIAYLFLVWLFGTVVVLLPKRRTFDRRMVRAIVSMAAVLTLGVVVLSVYAGNDLYFQIPIGIAFAAFMYTALMLPEYSGSWRRGRISLLAEEGANFSYSLYLLHMPLLVFLHSFFMLEFHGKWQPTPLYLAFGALIATVATLYAWLVSRITEAHTAKVRSWMERRLGMS